MPRKSPKIEAAEAMGFLKGARVSTQYRGTSVKGKIHQVLKDGYAIVILDDDDAETVMADAVEVPLSRLTGEP